VGAVRYPTIQALQLLLLLSETWMFVLGCHNNISQRTIDCNNNKKKNHQKRIAEEEPRHETDTKNPDELWKSKHLMKDP